jgi:heme A synthase
LCGLSSIGTALASGVATPIRSEDPAVVKDPRFAEIAWLLVIVVLVAIGGSVVFHALAQRRLVGSLVLGLAIVAALVMIRRAYVPDSPTVRADVTKAVAYCCSAILGFVAIAFRQHWAIGSTIIALEASLVFDLVTVASRRRDDGGASAGGS